VDVVGLVASLVVGAAFLVAGASKVAQGPQWPAQAAQLGVGSRLAAVVPWWELAVGALLVGGLLGPVPALAAYATLVAFTLRLIRLLRAGLTPPCACFGSWSTRAISWVDVARNAGLMVLCALALLR
jgi:hypothetical protein